MFAAGPKEISVCDTVCTDGSSNVRRRELVYLH